jgi:hypothetical protein
VPGRPFSSGRNFRHIEIVTDNWGSDFPLLTWEWETRKRGQVDQHFRVLGVLNIVWGALGALIGLIVLAVFAGAYGVVGVVAHRPEADLALPVIAIVGIAISLFLLILSAPSIIAGLGLLNHRSWAPVLTIVVSALHLLNFPFGTALGIYGLWVILSSRGLGYSIVDARS